MMSAAAYVVLTVGLFVALSLWVNGLLSALVAVVALGYGAGAPAEEGPGRTRHGAPRLAQPLEPLVSGQRP